MDVTQFRCICAFIEKSEKWIIKLHICNWCLRQQQNILSHRSENNWIACNLVPLINSKSSQSYRFEQKLSERIQNWNGKRLQRTRIFILFFCCPAAFYWNIQSQKNPKNDNNAPQYEWSWKCGFSTNIICAHRCHDHPLNFPPIHNRCHVTWAMLSLSFSMPPLPHCHFSFADNSIFLSLQQRNKQKKRDIEIGGGVNGTKRAHDKERQRGWAEQK